MHVSAAPAHGLSTRPTHRPAAPRYCEIDSTFTDWTNCPQDAGDRRGLDIANKITHRTISLLSAAHAVGAEFILENPADRGNRMEPSLFISEQHGPIWQLPELQTLATQCGAATCTFAQCRFSADHQKFTTLMYTAGLAPILHGWDTLRCNHTFHVADAGGKLDTDGWSFRISAAYPADT